MNRSNRNVKAIRAFTLIELLIVVAIIAILAAIAVPNFLEAQTRSKVARIHADLRTFATACEEYTVDYNRPPRASHTVSGSLWIAELGWPKLTEEEFNEWTPHTLLTTPVAYMTSILEDPFSQFGYAWRNSNTKARAKQPYWYYTFEPNRPGVWGQKTRAMGYTWYIRSPGPYNGYNWGQPPNILRYKAPRFDDETCYPYDPSNGTNSRGHIIRTNKGIFTVPGT